MLDNEEGVRLSGFVKDWLEQAEAKVDLRIVQSLTFSSIYPHYDAKIHCPLCHDSSKAGHKRPKSEQWPNSWEIPTLPQNRKNISPAH